MGEASYTRWGYIQRRDRQPSRGTTMAEPIPAAEHQHSYIHNDTKGDYLKRLRRIEGQARGLQRMVEEEQYCIDILTQVSARTKAPQSAALGAPGPTPPR